MGRKISLFIATIIFRIIYRVKVYGKEHLKKNGQIIIANHSHWMDAVAISVGCPIDFYILAKQQLFEKKFAGWFLRNMGAISVDREGNDFAVLRKSLRLLKDKSMVIFPEGTRNKTKQPLEGKEGVSILAYRSKCEVLPVTIDSSFRLFSKVKITIHPPVHFPEIEKPKSEDYKKFVQDQLNMIYKGLNHAS